MAFNNLTKADKKAAINILPDHIKHWKKKGVELSYIKHPASWLNGRHWEDQLDDGIIGDTKEDRDKKAKEEKAAYYAQIKERQQQEANAAKPEEISEIIGAISKKLSVGGK